MYNILFLIFYPILIAVLLAKSKKRKSSNFIIKISVTFIIFGALLLAISYFNKPSGFYLINSRLINDGMITIELLMTAYINYIGIKAKKHLVCFLSFSQALTIFLFEFSSNHRKYIFDHHLFVDKLSVIMVLIIAVIGGLISIYAISYMDDYHIHNKEIQDRRGVYFSLLFVFLSAMFGIVLSNDLVWIYFFWEITTLCSFGLIAYTKSSEAIKNSFTALTMNLIGGLAFAISIPLIGITFGSTELKDILTIGSTKDMIIPAILLSIAALTKSAQLPFSKWLLGAMVAPTPTSALLHSSTMVKAGVYLLIRISPIISGNSAGYMVLSIGGITFLLMSLIAISQSDAKRILAYSTMANLGLIVACAGVGSYESIWAAILLIIFHAISKSLMFLTVGATEHVIGSRDIEDMHGLIVKLPEMALMMAIGISGMFLAPFGMLISKWAALRAFIDSRNLFVVIFLVYGSAATLFYWTKWLGKITAVMNKADRLKCTVKKDEWIALVFQAVFTISLCVLYPLLSKYLIEPFIYDMFNVNTINIISEGNQQIIIIMLGLIIILPFGMRFLTSRNEHIVPIYMAGINEGDNKHFLGGKGESKKMYLSSWYMEKYFAEKKLLPLGIGATIILMVGIFSLAIGGAL